MRCGVSNKGMPTNSGGEDGWRMMLMLAVLRLKDGKF